MHFGKYCKDAAMRKVRTTRAPYSVHRSGVRWDLNADDLVIVADSLGECQKALDMEKVWKKEVSGAGKTE